MPGTPELPVSSGATQFQGTATELAWSEKVKVALAGQTVFGIAIVSDTIWPWDSVPLGRLKVIPLIPLLDAVQFRSPW